MEKLSDFLDFEVTKINFPDGSIRDCVRMKDVFFLARNAATFIQYTYRKHIPSIKIGSAKFVEVSKIKEWNSAKRPHRNARASEKPVFIGY